MNIWMFFNNKTYWSGYLDGVRSRTEDTKKQNRTYQTSKNKRKRELIRYYKNKIKELT